MAKAPFYLNRKKHYKPLVKCTVEKIQKIVQSGKAPEAWAIGDRYPIELNGTVGIYTFNHEVWYAEIIGFNHNANLETGGLPSVTFQFGQAEDGTEIAFIDSEYTSRDTTNAFRMNLSTDNSGGWESSYMRNTICPQFLEAMPEEWRDIIKPTVKYTDNVGRGSGNVESNITATEDKIFLLSEYEIFGSNGYSNAYEANYQTQYNDRYDDSSSIIRYRHSAPESTCYWWERSPYQDGGDSFCRVNIDGIPNAFSAYLSYGFAPAFTIF